MDAPSPRLQKRLTVLIGLLVLFMLLLLALVAAPKNFPSGSIITVAEGSSLSKLSIELSKTGVVRSPFAFRTLAILFGGEHGMQAGDYYLSRSESAISLAWRISHGKHSIDTLRITIPEGFTVAEISKLFDIRFQKFDHSLFLKEAEEGYMFPDTYFMEISTTATSTIKVLKSNFESKLAPIRPEIALSKHSEKEIIIMASILEAEAKQPEEMALASGILWKRLRLGMPLQVDSAPETYEKRGLPLKPINNPGLASIRAATHPKESPYLYFLTDKSGVMHYAKTFDEHKKNREKYLNK